MFSDTDRRAMLLVGLGPPGESRLEDIAIAVVDKSDQGPSLIFSDSRQKAMHFWIVFGVILVRVSLCDSLYGGFIRYKF